MSAPIMEMGVVDVQGCWWLSRTHFYDLVYGLMVLHRGDQLRPICGDGI